MAAAAKQSDVSERLALEGERRTARKWIAKEGRGLAGWGGLGRDGGAIAGRHSGGTAGTGVRRSGGQWQHRTGLHPIGEQGAGRNAQ